MNTQSRFPFLIFPIVVCLIVGCGGSDKEDMIAKRMKRLRSNADAEVEAAKVAPKSSVVSAKSSPTTTPVSLSNRRSDRNATDDVGQLDQSLIPIDSRRPSEPLSKSERRTRAVSNLKMIHAGVMKYAEEKKRFPPVQTKTTTGFDGLSWRVLILPQLGHQDLYDRFDQTKRWDEEPNLTLLKYIPDEYVSPERFDERTNYQVPIGSGFVFQHRTQTAPSLIEDGIDGTIFLIEVDDEKSVPWTQPRDFEPDYNYRNLSGVRDGLGGLRGDGTFAIWGGGYPTSLANSLRPELLLKAFQIDDGATGLPSMIHRDIDLGGDFDDPVFSPEMSDLSSENISEIDDSEIVSNQTNVVPDRMPVPAQIDIDRAGQRLQNLFREQLVTIERPSDREKFIAALLKQAAGLDSDPAGMYAMLVMAMNQSTEAGSQQNLLTAIDLIVSRFDVDAYQINVETLTNFVRGSTRNDDSISNLKQPFLGRMVRTMSAAIAADDYEAARNLCRFAMRMTPTTRGSDLSTLLAQLSVSLSESGSIYNRVIESLSVLRENSDDKQANATVGRYLCFVKGDWDRGLPLLRIGDSGPIGEMATRDLQGGDNTADQIAIGDAWWSLSERTDKAAFQNAAMDRANHWYEIAFDSLSPSIDRMHVKARLDETRDAAGNPIGLLRKLAIATRVDLSIPLSDVNVRRITNDQDENESNE